MQHEMQNENEKSPQPRTFSMEHMGFEPTTF